jgi:hypothetical protein
MHCTHALFEQCGVDVGQSMSEMHCTQPAVGIIPQRTAVPVPPPSPGAGLEPSVVPPLDVPLELPLPPELLEPPLDELPSKDPLEDPGLPSGLLVPLLLSSPPQPIPTATATAMAKPRQFLNVVMAGLTS